MIKILLFLVVHLVLLLQQVLCPYLIMGIKESVNAKIPKAIVIDLQNLKIAPPRLLRSALGDVLCRSTCQVDWLASIFF